MATQRKLNGVDSEKLWEAMKAVIPAVISNGAQHPPTGSAQVAREYARAMINEWRRSIRSAK